MNERQAQFILNVVLAFTVGFAIGVGLVCLFMYKKYT